MSQTERLEIVVSERGAPTVARQLSAIGDHAEKSAVQTNRLKNALVSLGAATGAIQLARIVDTYTDMQNRLKVVTTSSAQLKAVQQDLFSIANRSRSSYEATVELYGRLALSLKDAGVSTKTLLQVTESLNKATIISGASSTEAKNALIQLSQGLASGTLRGDELRSVLEQLPVVADAIAQKLGVTRGALRKLAEEGKLTTATVTQAVVENQGKWEELFAKSVPTMAQALTVVHNRFIEVAGGMDESLGASAAIAQAFLFLARNMETVAGVAATLATTLSLTLARYAISIVIGRMLDLLAVFAVQPLIAFTNAIGLITTALVAQVGVLANATKAVGLYLAVTGVGIAGFISKVAGGFALAVRAVSGFSLAAAAGALSLRGILAGIGGAFMLLLNPIRLVGATITGLTAFIGGAAVAAVRTFTASLTILGAVLGFTFRALSTILTVVATVGVGFVTLGDKALIAANSTVTYKDFALAAWEQIKTGFNSMVKFISGLWPSVGAGAKQAFGEADNSFVSYARKAAAGLDYVRAAFLATYDTILAQWRSFPAALADLVIQGVKKAYRAVVDFMGQVYSFLKDAITKIITLDFSGISTGGLDTQVSGAAERVGTSFNDALKKRLEDGNSFAQALENTLASAEKISKDRIAKEKAELEALQRERDKYGLQGPDKTTKLDDEEKRKPKVFADYLKELEREAALGLKVGDALRIANEQRSISDKLRQNLTDAEKLAVEAQVREIANLERKRDLLQEINGPTDEYNLKTQALNELFNSGAITLEQYNAKFFQLRENFINGLPEATTFADGFATQIEKMQNATRNGMGSIGTDVAKIFGPGGTLINGIGDAVAQTLVFGKSFKDQIRQIAQSILSQLIGSLVKVGLNMALQAATNQGLMAATTASGVAQAGALTAAYAPAAALSSLATGGANAAGASTGIATIFSLLASLGGSLFSSFKGFSDGGYTGAVGVKDVAGVVHGQEFVINAAATKRHRSLLEAINAGKDPLQPIVAAAQAPSMNVSITNEIPEAAYEVRQYGETEIEIIARRVVQREAAAVVANDLRNPNSRVSKSVSGNTTAGRRR